MKRLLSWLALAAVLSVTPAAAQFITPSGGSGAGGDVVGPGSSTDNAIARWDGTTGKLLKDSNVLVANTTGTITFGSASAQILLPDGSVGAPSLSFANQTDSGFALTADPSFGLVVSGTERIRFTSGTIRIATANTIGWSPSGAFGATDTTIGRRAAANFLLGGAADIAAPVAQTLSVQSVVAGTSDTAGAAFTLDGSQGTGTGAGGPIVFRTAPAGSTGSSQNALATAVTINSLGTFAQTIQANASAHTVTGYSLTGSNAQSMVDLAGTWNTSGTPTLIKANVTDTASNANSLLLDLQVGGSTRFRVLKDPYAFFGVGQGANDPYIAGARISSTNLLVGGASNLTSWAASSSQMILAAATSLAWNSGTFASVAPDLILARDAANTLAQRNGANAQTHNLYDTYTSATDYHRVAVKTARATLSGVTGASVTATGIIPDGAVVVGVTTKVTTGLGTGSGTTGYQVGDGSDADRWGSITGTIAGTTSDNRDWTATTVQAFTAASDVVITASGGNFDGTGVIYVSVQYLIGQAD